ncbi:MAG: Hpt domain-containing protein, partial [Thermodesulfobacteriota bacterium]|nr:Hpt domain-containing protein [Thermodesulfobacteriota bacterium]
YLELIELFIETGISDLNTLQSESDSGNAENAANAAHSIKGASGSLGLTEIYEATKMVEKTCRDGMLDNVSESVQELKKMVNKIKG